MSRILALLTVPFVLLFGFAADAQISKTFVVGSVEQLQQLEGVPQWADNTRRRLEGSRWIFAPDNTFVLHLPDARTDLYPLQGTYRVSGPAITFEAGRTATIGATGTASVVWQGTLDLATGATQVHFVSNTGNTAKIGGVGDIPRSPSIEQPGRQRFDAQSTSAYSAVLRLVEQPDAAPPSQATTAPQFDTAQVVGAAPSPPQMSMPSQFGAPPPAAAPPPFGTPVPHPDAPPPGPPIPSPAEVLAQWSGRYYCAQGVTGLTLSVTRSDQSGVEALFDFYPVRGNYSVPPGRFVLQGQYDPATRQMVLLPVAWVHQPPGYHALAIQGWLDPQTNALRGTFIGAEGCTLDELAWHDPGSGATSQPGGPPPHVSSPPAASPTPGPGNVVRDARDYIRSYCADPNMAAQLRPFGYCR